MLEIENIFNDFVNSKDPKPQIMMKIKDLENSIIIVEIDSFDDEEMPLDATDRIAGPRLLEECMTLHGCPTGEARITHGYNLPAKYVIHTVGPVYAGKTSDAHMLASCYYNSLALAKKAGLHSVIFSAISTGVYGYPAEDATKIAVDAIEKWQKENSGYKLDISMCAYDNRMYRIYEKMVA